MSQLTSYCYISKEAISINDEKVFCFNTQDGSVNEMLTIMYKQLNIKYTKFHKMDSLSKIAFLGVEILKKQSSQIDSYGNDEIALIFSNRSSSADSDMKFANSYEMEGPPSPSLFVYTLPNILIGEIAIRNRWYGENLFIILPKFDPVFFSNYCKILFSKNTKACICGWVEVVGEEIEGFLFLIEKTISSSGLLLTPETILKIYKTNKYAKS